MINSPPSVNLLVIRSENIDQAVTFYQTVGLTFDKHRHGAGPEHYACEQEGFVFEIYPLAPGQQGTTSVRLGLSVDKIDSLVDNLAELGAEVVSRPKDSEWGRRAVVKDLDGHSVELLETNEMP